MIIRIIQENLSLLYPAVIYVIKLSLRKLYFSHFFCVAEGSTFGIFLSEA